MSLVWWDAWDDVRQGAKRVLRQARMDADAGKWAAQGPDGPARAERQWDVPVPAALRGVGALYKLDAGRSAAQSSAAPEQVDAEPE